MINPKPFLWVGLILFGLCVGCAAKPQQSAHLGECKELRIPQRVWEGREEASVGPVLLTEISQENIFWSKKEVVGVIDAGTRVSVDRILKDWNGSYGHFLRVQVKILDGPFRGWIAEVPSVAPYHPKPSWIVEHTLNPNALQFNPEVVKACDLDRYSPTSSLGS